MDRLLTNHKHGNHIMMYERLITACHSRVAALSGYSALVFPSSDITLELNRIFYRNKLSVVCRCGQSRLSINWLGAAHGLVFPLRSGACAVVQKSPSKRQCNKRQARLKAAYKLTHRRYSAIQNKNLY